MLVWFSFRLIKYLAADTIDADLQRLRLKKTDYDSNAMPCGIPVAAVNAVNDERLDRLEKLLAKFEKKLSGLDWIK